MNPNNMSPNSVPMKRHPIPALAVALAVPLVAVIAAGCTGRDIERDGFARSAADAPAQYATAANATPAQYTSPAQYRSPAQFQPASPFPSGAQFRPASQSVRMAAASDARFDVRSDVERRPDREADQASPNARLQQLMQWERRDMGVAPTRSLHDGPMHGPTPNQIPGGQVITTLGLTSLMQQQAGARVIDVLGAEASLPQAIPAAFAAAPGSFDDQTQEQVAALLAQVTGNNPGVPLVFYCGGPECWMSYNAALRAIALGYRNVLWYRGGVEAWHHAGLPLASRAGNSSDAYDRG